MTVNPRIRVLTLAAALAAGTSLTSACGGQEADDTVTAVCESIKAGDLPGLSEAITGLNDDNDPDGDLARSAAAVAEQLVWIENPDSATGSPIEGVPSTEFVDYQLTFFDNAWTICADQVDGYPGIGSPEHQALSESIADAAEQAYLF